MFGILIGVVACSGRSSSQLEVTNVDVIPSVFVATSTNAPTPIATNAASSTSPVPVTITYALPTSATAVSSPSISTQSSIHRHLQYISTSNTLISITVTPIGSAPTTYGPNACTSTACTISFTATPGPTVLAFTLTDGSSNVLSRFSTTTIVQPSAINTLSFTANPVVSSVVLQLASTTVNAGTPANELVTVKAQDADGKTIVGNASYVDVNGNPVALTLDVHNNQSGGKGSVTIQGPSYMTAPVNTTIYAHYDGNWLASSTISVTSNSSAISTLTGATLTTKPAANENIMTGLNNPYQIIKGPDGAIWFTETGGNKVSRLSLSGSYSSYNVGNTPSDLINGVDGNIYVANQSSNFISKISLSSGTVSSIPTLYGQVNIVQGPDGNIWYSAYSNSFIDKVTSGGIDTPYSNTTSQSWGLALGSDENLWYASNNNGVIGRMTPLGLPTLFGPTGCGTNTWSITNGPDGNLWSTDRSGGCIARTTPSGVITIYTSGLSGLNPVNIITGPDGALWFGENSSYIGRIDTSGNITKYSTGITAGSGPQGLAIGPDGNIWFTEWNAGRVGKFVY